MQLVVFLLYLFSVIWGAFFIRKAFQQRVFSFHLFFSVVYFVTFYFGFPLSWMMAVGFEHTLPFPDIQLNVFLVALVGYCCYQLGYSIVYRLKKRVIKQPSLDFANFSAKLTACLLAFVAVGTLVAFILLNDGLLLFKLEKYSQIFSAQVQGVALKRFFYFALPALIIFFLLKPSRERWFAFLFLGTLFGVVSYLAVGGTRANLAMAVLFFVLLGLYQGYLSAKWLFWIGLIGVFAMFGLALARYGLDIQGREAWFTFLYLTRDTFSPWENVAKIVSSELEFQGLMPIVRDFYVYIPNSLWAERPDIVWNTANYFTKVILGNQSGLAISPTILGSFYIMGGEKLIYVGMVIVGGILAIFDRLFEYGKQYSVILQVFCLGNLFNLIILIREGADAFVSRFFFFSTIFALCWSLAIFFEKWRKSYG